MALYAEDLDQAVRNGCDTPGCAHKHESTLYLHARCHPAAKLQVLYDSETQSIRTECAICKKPVVEIAVAGRIVL